MNKAGKEDQFFKVGKREILKQGKEKQNGSKNERRKEERGVTNNIKK